jgi:hypothetical protein
MLASTVLDEAAALLNDQGKATFTYTNMLPLLSKANDELETALTKNGLSVNRQLSSTATIAIGTVLFPLPADLLTPLVMSERNLGSSDLFSDMDEVRDQPEEAVGSDLKYWSYSNMLLKLGPANNVGANSAREVKLIYQRLLTPLTSQNAVVDVSKAKSYLAERTAGLAARFIGENEGRADTLDVMARGPHLDGEGGSIYELVQIFVRNLQGQGGVKRKPYRRTR